MPKKLLFGEEARSAMLSGATRLTNAVRPPWARRAAACQGSGGQDKQGRRRRHHDRNRTGLTGGRPLT